MERASQAVNSYRRREHCRACGERSLDKFFDLGAMPLANGFLEAHELAEPEAKFPLSVAVCRSCCLVQLQEIVPPELLFRDYPYVSSASAPLINHFRNYAEEIHHRFIADPNDLVVEIGSNDGIFLQHLADKARVLGVDPARNIAAIAASRGIPTIPEFFSDDVAAQIKKQYGPAKVVVASNVIAHVDDLDSVLRGVHELLRDDGVFTLEVHWVNDLITHRGFDQIYHEHVSYFGIRPLERLLTRLGIETFAVEVIPMHGKLLRVFTRKSGVAGFGIKRDASLHEIAAEEIAAGLADLATYREFAESIAGIKTKLVSLLHDLKAQGKRIVGYGAPAKGNIMLNYCNIGGDLIDYMTDTTPQKQGRYTPGTHIPVSFPERAKHEVPDYYVLFAWNYADAILEKEREFRSNGGKFIIPIPEPYVV